MGITVEIWRCRVGAFAFRFKLAKSKNSKPRQLRHALPLTSTTVAALRFCLLLLSAGDVESNPGPNVLKCLKCNFETSQPMSFFKHQLAHSQDRNPNLKCPISSACQESFSTFGAFKTHIYRHEKRPTENYLRLEEKTLVCQIQLCNSKFKTIEDLKSHLRKQHLQKGVHVPCIFKSCDVIFKTVNYFNVHLSRDHANRTDHENFFNNQALNMPSREDSADISDAQMDDFFSYEHMDEDDDEEEVINQEEDFVTTDQFIKTIATFYLKLEAQYLFPEVRIQAINTDFYSLLSIARMKQEKRLKELLARTSIPKEEQEAITRDFFQADVLHEVHNPNSNAGYPQLHSTHLREKYIRSNFIFVEPELIDMKGVDTQQKKVSAYIVPLDKTINALFSDPKFQDEIEISIKTPKSPSNVLSDYTDGEKYQKSDNSLTPAIELIFYQDGFEVVVPIGSARLKHKLLAFYYMFGNLAPKFRTKLDMIQLAMLVKEADWKLPEVRQRCMDTLVRQISGLVTNGIRFKDQVLQVRLESFMGDNLGSHHIGGYVESFSASYFCRYCNLSSQEFVEDPTQLKPLRTPQEYDSIVAKILTEDHIEGIKFSSDLNKIPGFHVSLPGLPPCIHHDLSEGVINYDMALIIKGLIKAGWFTLRELNKMIDSFKCKDPDSGDKPSLIPAILKALAGNAVQNWNMVRFFPAIIKHRLKDPEQPEWQLYISLRHLCDVICAPVITKEQAVYLQVVAEGYLFDRKKVFPNTPLRPKHHFVLHYSELTLELGPLTRYSTLRCESKHCPFKRMARACGNYINLCYTLVMKHQMKFAYSLTDLFPSEVVYIKSEILQPNSFLPELEKVLNAMNFTKTALELKVVSVSGVQYKVNQILIIGAADPSTFSFSLYVGDIYSILYDKGVTYFLIKRHLATWDEETGFYAIQEDPYDPYMCLPLNKLSDHLPLATHNLSRPAGPVKFISLKYFLPFM